MNFDLSAFDIDEAVNRLTLAKSFEFETRRSLEDCILRLRQLQPNHDWNIHFGGPRTVHEVVISQFDDHHCYYDVSTMYRSRRSAGYSRTANVNGKLSFNPETGVTTVTGETKLNAGGVLIVIIAIVLLIGITLFMPYGTFFALFGIGAIIYMVYGMVRDQANLVRVIQSL